MAVPPSTGPASAQPGAFELLERVRNAYRELPSYHDRGVIERSMSGGRAGAAPPVARLRFTTAADSQGRFRFVLAQESGETAVSQVFWRQGGEAFHYDAGRGQYRAVDSLVAALVHGFGEGGFEALVVPALLAGDPEALSSPEVAAVDGPEPCGDTSCYRVSVARMSGTVESKLWIDGEHSLIRRLEVHLHTPQAVLERAAAAAGLPPPRRGGGMSEATSVHLVVRHEPTLGGEAPLAAEAAYVPPASARRVAEWEPPAAAATPSVPGPAQSEDRGLDPDAVFRDAIDVTLVTVVVRVVDSHGNPVLGLAADDFRVRRGKELLPVQAVDWVSSESPDAALATLPPALLAETGAVVDPPGKLVVFFVQADFHPIRITGHLRMLPRATSLLETFHRDDRIAVVSFDSHLKLRQDFTHDVDLVEEALRQAIRTGKPPAVEPGWYPSLARHLDPQEAKRAASPEKALELTARALKPLHGEKAVIFLGWGLGRFGSGGMRMTPQYHKARRALEEARATVFVLDVTNADWHTLEIGLKQVVEDTGGTYAKTHVFPSQVTRRLGRTLSGHYVLTLARPTTATGRRRLRIDLPEKEGRVLTAVSYL